VQRVDRVGRAENESVLRLAAAAGQ
jgi:hypothetical protein